MIGLAATFVLQTALLAQGAMPYDEAFREHETNGKPLLILVGADWCPACQTMKNGTLARMERGGKLKNVAFSIVNTDRERKIATSLMRGGSIPQLVLFTKTDKGWDRQQVIGAQSEQAVEAMIGQALELQASLPSKTTPTATDVRTASAVK